jgi:hypothetical protein
LLWPKLQNKPSKGKGGKRRVSPHVKLAVTLRFMAGGSIDDLKLIYGLRSTKTVYNILWCTVDAINQLLPMDFPITDTNWLRELEVEFAACSSARHWHGGGKWGQWLVCTSP